jgi:hypothetical protein
MTSAANLHLLLSGSKPALFFFSLLGFLLLSAGCGTQRQATEDKAERDKPDKEVKEHRVPIDTIHWTEISPEDMAPVGYPEDSPYRDRIPEEIPPPVLKDQYSIALFLSMEEWPEEKFWEEWMEEDMEEEEKEEIKELIPSLNESALAFLNGFEYAFLREKAEGVDFRVEAYAIGERKTKEEILKKLDELNFSADLIIGGESRAELEALSEFAARKQSVLVNPWFPGRFEVAPGAQVVSLQPGLMDHFEMVLRQLAHMDEDDSFYVIYSPREEGRVAEFKNLFNEYFPDRVFGEIFFKDDKDILEFKFEEFFEEESTSWFFLPMTRNHPFIYPVLRTIDLRAADYDYKILGITLWDRDVHLELHSKMDIYNSSAHSPVYGDSVLIDFNRKFFDHMEYVGSVEEYEGFVIGDFVRRSLMVYGSEFPSYLPFSETTRTYFNFRFKEYGLVEEPVEDFGLIPSNLQNKGLYILRFDGGKFKVIAE